MALFQKEIVAFIVPEGHSAHFMNFAELNLKLTKYLRERIQSGEITERGLARATGISQPHIHNVLKGKRMLSGELADEVLRKLHLDLKDFLQDD